MPFILFFYRLTAGLIENAVHLKGRTTDHTSDLYDQKCEEPIDTISWVTFLSIDY